MILHAQAPCRIGIAGGGTDLPAWTKERTGYCLSLAIATYVHAVAIRRPDGRVVASYSRRDEASCATEIANGLIRESALLHGWEDGFEVHLLSEVSAHGTGLGVSSSIAVALASLFARMTCCEQGTPSTADAITIATYAWNVEIDRLRRPIGRQDHMAAAFGGLRLYAFGRVRDVEEARIERTFTREDAAWIARHLVLLPLPDGHDARGILSGVKHSAQLQAAFDAIPIAVRAIEDRDPCALGKALSMGLQAKREIPGAVPEPVHRAIERAEAIPGVYGVKVAGAGGGGHLVVACDEEAFSRLQALSECGAWRPAADLHGVQSEVW